jgi:hypothetical protein
MSLMIYFPLKDFYTYPVPFVYVLSRCLLLVDLRGMIKSRHFVDNNNSVQNHNKVQLSHSVPSFVDNLPEDERLKVPSSNVSSANSDSSLPDIVLNLGHNRVRTPHKYPHQDLNVMNLLS